jgi:hypothetical protein
VKELVRSTKKNPPAKVGVDVIYVSVAFDFWFGIGCGMEGTRRNGWRWMRDERCYDAAMPSLRTAHETAINTYNF